ncbi:MAG: hypothetical protein COU81_02260, partial [Candidatus Portnoybacteria bacterium CG10_big_fil_rev_8_21_14_0_10_36_7]
MRYVVSHETPLFSILRRLRGKTEKRFVLLENSYMQDVHTRVRLSESGEALHDKIVRLEGSEADLKAANEKLRLAYTDLEMMIQRQGHDVGNTMGMLESMSYSIKDLYYDILRMIDDASKAESLDEINEKLTAANRIMEEGRAIVDFFPK